MSTHDIKVSLIVPVYNVEKYLDECLASCINQTIDSFEVVVINDGTKDNSQIIIDKYVNEYPKIVRSFIIENGGLGNARNVGISKSKGEYVAFIDSDDIISYTYCEEMYNLAKENEADVVRCDYVRFKDVTGVYRSIDTGLESSAFASFVKENGNVFDKLDAKLQLIIWHIACTGIYRRKRLEEIDFKFPKGVIEDPVMKILFLEANKIVVCPRKMYYYRLRGDSITSELDFPMRKVALDRWVGIIDYYEQKGHLNDSGIIEAFLFTAASYYVIIRELKDRSISQLQEMYSAGEYDDFIDFFKRIDPDTIRDSRTKGIQKFVYRIIIRNFYKGNLRFCKFMVEVLKILHRLSRVFKKAVRFAKKITIKMAKVIWLIARKIVNVKIGELFYPILCKKKEVNENSVLLESYHQSSFNGNIYYLGQQFVNDGYEVIIATKSNFDMTGYNKSNVKIVKPRSFKYYKALATSKYLLNNTSYPRCFMKRDGQVVVNTWHGTPLKTLGKDMVDDRYRFGNIQRTIGLSDMIVLGNTFTVEKFIDTHELDSILEDNVYIEPTPRNAIFFDSVEELDVRKQLGCEGKKVIVYMPTWRGSVWEVDDVNQFFIDTVTLLSQELSDDYVIYYKFHSNNSKFKMEEFENLKYMPSNIETYRFLNIADILITDYSSVMFDFALKNRKVILYTPDLEKYEQERGMYFSVEQLGFSVSKSIEGVISEIMNTENIDYSIVNKRFNSKDCLDANKIVYDKIKSYTVKKRDKNNNILFFDSLSDTATNHLLDKIDSDLIYSFLAESHISNSIILDKILKDKRYYPIAYNKRSGVFKRLLRIMYESRFSPLSRISTPRHYNNFYSNLSELLFSYMNFKSFVLVSNFTIFSLELFRNTSTEKKGIFINESYENGRAKKFRKRIISALEDADVIFVYECNLNMDILKGFESKITVIEEMFQDGKFRLTA